MRRALICLSALLLLPVAAAAQERPLQTVDAETVPPGTLRAAIGFDFLQDVDFPLSGLNGDLTSIGVVGFRMGVGKLVEVQLSGVIQNFLDIKAQGVSFAGPLQLSGANSTHDVGDFALATKIRLVGESGKRPGIAFEFGFIMPNSNQAKGIGTNTTNVFALVALEKHLKGVQLTGNLGIEILQAPNALFSQNDVLLYGFAFSVPVRSRLHVVGEIAGRQSTRSIATGLLGTESQSQARLGVQLLAGGLTWDVAGIAGLQTHDPKAGVTFGVTKDITLFDYGRVK
ncbi:MAG TPA: transporter [Methylomirabilota bacterium]|nr:transporter [Methylomirabilota bacterium]